MSEQCSHDCNSCKEECGERKTMADFRKEPHRLSRIKKVVGVVSGKGGVGKSLVTSMLAVNAERSGKKAAILDADITGPSIPRIFGLREGAVGSELGIYPVSSQKGVKIMSLNLLIEDETEPVIWRGPVIAGTVQQFWTDVIWDDVDVMFVDMPPGTGDVPLTVFQSIPLDGIVVVASPQELVSMIVEKAVKMAEKMNVPVLGLVENMSYFQCPDCKGRHAVFGESHIDAIGIQYEIERIARLPIEPEAARACDQGLIEEYQGESMEIINSTFSELFFS